MHMMYTVWGERKNLYVYNNAEVIRIIRICFNPLIFLQVNAIFFFMSNFLNILHFLFRFFETIQRERFV